MINANQADFLRMVNEPAAPGSQPSMEQLAAQLAAGGGEGVSLWQLLAFRIQMGPQFPVHHFDRGIHSHLGHHFTIQVSVQSLLTIPGKFLGAEHWTHAGHEMLKPPKPPWATYFLVCTILPASTPQAFRGSISDGQHSSMIRNKFTVSLFCACCCFQSVPELSDLTFEMVIEALSWSSYHCTAGIMMLLAIEWAQSRFICYCMGYVRNCKASTKLGPASGLM